MVRKIICVFSLCCFCISAIATEIRHITPPKLSSKHIGEKILDYRPVRINAPNMSLQKIGDKLIGHNYGHGGGGWTLGPGSAQYVVSLLLSSTYYKNNPANTITIIGAGALGLFTAFELCYNHNLCNVTIVAKKFNNLVSHNAGGLLAPVSMKNSPDMKNLIDDISIDAYKFYRSIALQKHIIPKGATIMTAYFASKKDSGLEPYVGKVMNPAKDVILDFGNGTKRNMVAYDDGIFIDTIVLMQALTNMLKEKNVNFIKKEITSFSEITDNIIFNCSGLGSKTLNNDQNMVPIQGHLVMLKDQNPKDLQYMILVYLDKHLNQHNQTVQHSYYMFPKHFPNSSKTDYGVLGGTFIENADDNTPNYIEFEHIIENAKQFYGIKQ